MLFVMFSRYLIHSIVFPVYSFIVRVVHSPFPVHCYSLRLHSDTWSTHTFDDRWYSGDLMHLRCRSTTLPFDTDTLSIRCYSVDASIPIPTFLHSTFVVVLLHSVSGIHFDPVLKKLLLIPTVALFDLFDTIWLFLPVIHCSFYILIPEAIYDIRLPVTDTFVDSVVVTSDDCCYSICYTTAICSSDGPTVFTFVILSLPFWYDTGKKKSHSGIRCSIPIQFCLEFSTLPDFVRYWYILVLLPIDTDLLRFTHSTLIPLNCSRFPTGDYIFILLRCSTVVIYRSILVFTFCSFHSAIYVRSVRFYILTGDHVLHFISRRLPHSTTFLYRWCSTVQPVMMRCSLSHIHVVPTTTFVDLVISPFLHSCLFDTVVVRFTLHSYIHSVRCSVTHILRYIPMRFVCCSYILPFIRCSDHWWYDCYRCSGDTICPFVWPLPWYRSVFHAWCSCSPIRHCCCYTTLHSHYTTLTDTVVPLLLPQFLIPTMFYNLRYILLLSLRYGIVLFIVDSLRFVPISVIRWCSVVRWWKKFYIDPFGDTFLHVTILRFGTRSTFILVEPFDIRIPTCCYIRRYIPDDICSFFDGILRYRYIPFPFWPLPQFPSRPVLLMSLILLFDTMFDFDTFHCYSDWSDTIRYIDHSVRLVDHLFWYWHLFSPRYFGLPVHSCLLLLRYSVVLFRPVLSTFSCHSVRYEWFVRCSTLRCCPIYIVTIRYRYHSFPDSSSLIPVRWYDTIHIFCSTTFVVLLFRSFVHLTLRLHILTDPSVTFWPICFHSPIPNFIRIWCSNSRCCWCRYHIPYISLLTTDIIPPIHSTDTFRCSRCIHSLHHSTIHLHSTIPRFTMTIHSICSHSTIPFTLLFHLFFIWFAIVEISTIRSVTIVRCLILLFDDDPYIRLFYDDLFHWWSVRYHSLIHSCYDSTCTVFYIHSIYLLFYHYHWYRYSYLHSIPHSRYHYFPTTTILFICWHSRWPCSSFICCSSFCSLLFWFLSDDPSHCCSFYIPSVQWFDHFADIHSTPTPDVLRSLCYSTTHSIPIHSVTTHWPILFPVDVHVHSGPRCPCCSVIPDALVFIVLQFIPHSPCICDLLVIPAGILFWRTFVISLPVFIVDAFPIPFYILPFTFPTLFTICLIQFCSVFWPVLLLFTVHSCHFYIRTFHSTIRCCYSVTLFWVFCSCYHSLYLLPTVCSVFILLRYFTRCIRYVFDAVMGGDTHHSLIRYHSTVPVLFYRYDDFTPANSLHSHRYFIHTILFVAFWFGSILQCCCPYHSVWYLHSLLIHWYSIDSFHCCWPFYYILGIRAHDLHHCYSLPHSIPRWPTTMRWYTFIHWYILLILHSHILILLIRCYNSFSWFYIR